MANRLASVLSVKNRSAAAIDFVRWLDGELQQRPAPALLIVIGFGDGTVLAAIEQRLPGVRVLALEPEPARVPSFLANPLGVAWRESGRLLYLADPDYAGANDAWRLFPANGAKPLVLTHPELERCGGLARAKDVLKKVLFGVEANAAARRRFAPRYLTNSLANLPAMLRGNNLEQLRGAYRGRPAVIAGAGPSLDASVEPLRRRAGGALVIATDTALRPLLTGGVTPQLVVGMDPGAANLRHFLSLPECRDTWLVAESALDPGAATRFEERTFWFRVANHQPWPFLNELGVDICRLEVWGSVLTGALQVAVLAGCDPIVIVGADLAYSEHRPYARGTTYEFDWAWYAGYGRSLNDTWAALIAAAKPIEAIDLDGETTQTTEVLQSFRDWTAAQARKSGRRVINAGGSGILTGDGIEHRSLDEALGESGPLSSIARFARPAGREQQLALALRLREVQGALAEEQTDLRPLPEWIEFSGNGFDATAVASALAAAAQSLESPAPTPLRSSGWAAYLGAQRDSGRRNELSEASLRLHAGLNGIPLAATPSCDTDAERSLLLQQAFEELAAICRLLLAEETDVVPVTNLPEYGQLPVALEYAWPDEQRWAIQAFEGLLGKGWAPCDRHDPAPFYNRHVRQRQVEPNGSSDAPAFRNPHNLKACQRLVSEWLRCVRSVPGAAATWTFDLERVLVFQALLRCDAPSDQRERSAWISLHSASGARVDIPLGFSEPSLARALTGAIRPTLDSPAAIVSRSDRRQAPFLVLHRNPLDLNAAPPDSATLCVVPRALSEERGIKAAVAYATAHGVVCVTPNEPQSVLVAADGSVSVHHTWPRGIVGELPLGDGGAVAWGSGPAALPESHGAYVMYRSARDAAVVIEELPVRPVCGVWWRERLYWSCWPGSAGEWSGLASWAPGEGLVLEIPGLPPIAGLHPGSDSLTLEPLRLGPQGRIGRGGMSWGWTWRPGEAPRPHRLAPQGAATAVASHRGWTATAYFAMDAIHLRSDAGREQWLTCYNPFRLAWFGQSLLVSTIERELCWFENLCEVLVDGR